MTIVIKRSKNPINYTFAINELEKQVNKIIHKNVKNELIWFLEHESVYTGGTSFKRNEILDNKINVIQTKRGGKITWHGPGQLVCYFVLDLNKRNKDIRKLIEIIEKSIIETLREYKIRSFADRKNIGIWHHSKTSIKKIAAIGIRVKKWVAHHGFSINIKNDLDLYKKIIPCGIKNKKITSLIKIKKQNYSNISKILEKKLIKNLKI